MSESNPPPAANDDPENDGWDARDLLRDLQRGEHGIFEIISTPFADWLDAARREWWLQEGEPESARSKRSSSTPVAPFANRLKFTPSFDAVAPSGKLEP